MTQITECQQAFKLILKNRLVHLRNACHVIASADIAAGVDQIAYDAELHRVYCASAKGKIVILGVEKDRLAPAGEVASSEGARSIVADAKTHTVWIAYEKGGVGMVQPFMPPK